VIVVSLISNWLFPASVSLAWNPNPEKDIAGYWIYRSTTSGKGYSRVNLNPVTTTSFVDTSVAPGLTYYYAVTAVSTSGEESPKSNEVQATVPPSSSGGANRPPSADSGGNQTVWSGATVVLAGTATDPDGDALTYLWRQVGGSSIPLTGANTPTASFTAPVVSKELKLVFDFIVSDGRGGTDHDRMAVYVKPASGSTNKPPTANAGPDLTTTPGAKVTLSGSGSDPDGDTLSYSWTQVSGTGVALSGSGATATFTAPAVSVDTSLVFRLTVTDGKGGSASDDVKVLVDVQDSGVNHPPVAVPGPNQTVVPGAKVTLSGEASYDPDGDPISYVLWKQVSGPTVSLSSKNSLVTSFVAPQVSRDTELILRLGIKDSHGAGDDARVSVLIDVPEALMASAGADQHVLTGTTVILNGSRRDPDDGEAVSFQWEQISGPAVSLEGADTPTPRFRAPRESGSAEYGFRLRISDGRGRQAEDECRVKVARAGDLVLPATVKGSDRSLEDSFVGLAFLNASEESNRVELSGVNEQSGGAVLSRLEFGPRSQEAFLTESLSGVEATSAIRARDERQSLQGFFLVGDSRPKRLDGIGGLMAPGETLYFTLAAGERRARTQLFVSNSGEEAAKVGLELVEAGGQVGARKVLDLPARASRLLRLGELAGSVAPDREYYLRVDSNVAVAGFVLAVGEEDVWTAAGQQGIPAARLWLPHFVVGPQGEETELRLINVEDTAGVEARVEIYDDEGKLLGTRFVEIPAGGLSVTRLSEWITAVPAKEGLLSGHARVEVFSEGGKVLGTATFTSTGGRARSTLPLWREPRSETVYLQVAQSSREGIFTGLALLNPNDQAVTVIVEAYDRSGRVSGRKEVEIAAGKRLVDLLDGPQLFGAGFEQIQGHLRVIARRPVVSFVMFGDGTLEFLSAVEGQPALQ